MGPDPSIIEEPPCRAKIKEGGVAVGNCGILVKLMNPDSKNVA